MTTHTKLNAVPSLSQPVNSEQAAFLQSLKEKSNGGTLRGDYAGADKDYVVAQQWSAYSPDQHNLWRKLYARQSALLPGRACDAFIDNLEKMQAAEGIPNLMKASELLFNATGWTLVAVPGLVPDAVFFAHLAARRFPVTVWLREPHEFDYIVEPDIFHDFFGHVPLLMNSIFADHLQEYGKGGFKALALGGLHLLARLYWYTIEFGLIDTVQGLRAFGAGLLSSGAEIDYCLTSTQTTRLAFDVERVMRTLYKIDSYQETYFVIRDFEQLLRDTEVDFTPLYDKLLALPPLAAGTVLSTEKNLPIFS
jgi:phenylalanine-4-hydroxylase